jgi:polyisoprenoid-binding protein YceI
MNLWKNNSVLLSLCFLVAGQLALSLGESSTSDNHAQVAASASASTPNIGPAASRYVIRPDRSRFMANVKSGGLLWFLGHSHHLAIREFKGEAQLTPGNILPASLTIDIRAESIEETAANFTQEQKQIINGTMRKVVLEVGEYPDITFRSSDIKIERKGENQFEATIAGQLALHGVVKPVTIPARISINGDTLEATGHFSVKRSDYGVKTHAIKWGTIRVRNKIRFTFNILAQLA